MGNGERMVENISIDKLEIVPEIQELFPSLSKEEYEGLKRGIQNDGILCPIVVSENLKIIDGYTRRKIALEQGITEVPIKRRKVDANRTIIEESIAYNKHRRQLTLTVRAKVAMKWEEQVAKPAARKRQARKGKLSRKGFPGQLSEDKGDSRDVIANKFRLGSGKQYEKLKRIVVDGTDEERKAIDTGERSVHSVYMEIKKRKAKPSDETSVSTVKKEPSKKIKRLITRIEKVRSELEEMEDDSSILSDLEALESEISAIGIIILNKRKIINREGKTTSTDDLVPVKGEINNESDKQESFNTSTSG